MSKSIKKAKPSKSRTSSRGRAAGATNRDHIRVVPLHLPGAAPAAAPAQLTYRNGPLISAVQVFTMFWGSAWNTAPQKTMAADLNHFFDYVLTSALIDQLAEYSVPKFTIRHGKRSGTTTIASPAPGTSVTDAAIQKMLTQQISTNKAVPKPTPNSLYFLFLPPGVRVVMGGSSSCQSFCGYHSNIGSTIFYAVMPFPGCSGCTGGIAPFDALTSTSSHELCEAITDPIPGQGWYDDVNGEVGDICAWQTKPLGKYTVQLEWSNRENRCV
jgi:hypothetical protein